MLLSAYLYTPFEDYIKAFHLLLRSDYDIKGFIVNESAVLEIELFHYVLLHIFEDLCLTKVFAVLSLPRLFVLIETFVESNVYPFILLIQYLE